MSGPDSQAITERYDREAAAYRDLWAPVLRIAAAVLIAELEPGPVGAVLDVGAGVGSLLPDLGSAFPGARVVGVDRSRGMLRHAPRKSRVAVMDAAGLAFRDASVDRVVMAFMLFHLADPGAALAEARRVLRVGGLIGSLTWAGELESPATRIWAAALDAHGAEPADPAAATRHDPVDSPAKMEALLQSAGFERLRAWGGDFQCRLAPDHLIRLRTSMGAAKPRFDSMPPAARAACVADARARMARLDARDFFANGPVVFAVGAAR